MTPPFPRPAGNQRWLITFADLAAVLLAFFVMMFAMAEVDTDRWEGAVDALSRRLFVQSEEGVTPRPQAERNVPVLRVETGHDLAYLSALLERQLARATSIDADVRMEEDRLVLSLGSRSLFDGPGSALRPAGREFAFSLAGVLAGLRNEVAVVVYTRAARQEGVGAGLARAVALRDALQSAGFGREIRASVQPVGITRRSVSRRVDILVRDARSQGG